jgi:hypothetical protein
VNEKNKDKVSKKNIKKVKKTTKKVSDEKFDEGRDSVLKDFTDKAEKLLENSDLTAEARDEIMKEAVEEKHEELNETNVKDVLKKIESFAERLSGRSDEKNFLEEEKEREIKNTNRNLIMSIVGYYKKVIETRDELIKLIQESPISEKQLNFFMKTIKEYEASIEKLILIPKETLELSLYENICGKMGLSAEEYKSLYENICRRMGWPEEYKSGDMYKNFNIIKNNSGVFTRRSE